MTFTLSLFLLIYLVFLAIFVALAIATLYHLLKYGPANGIVFFMAFIFIALSVLWLFLSWQYIASVDWSEEINFFQQQTGMWK